MPKSALHPKETVTRTGALLPGSRDIELINASIPVGHVRSVLFDFDGTVSLIREGWRDIMIPMMVEILADLGGNETGDQLHAVVSEFVDRLTGRQTIYQMVQLAEEVTKRGGTPADPLEYKRQYNDRLLEHIDGRLEGLAAGSMAPEALTLPGTVALLEHLSDRGFALYLASGTDIAYVRNEARLLGIDRFFAGRIFGALDRHESFSKAMVIQDILREHGLNGDELLGFGDGYVEIENVKAVGGIAVGVASDEKRREGVDAWKRDRLIRAGADVIIPEYREQEQLIAYLCDS